jgi:hypothetical protein
MHRAVVPGVDNKSYLKNSEINTSIVTSDITGKNKGQVNKALQLSEGIGDGSCWSRRNMSVATTVAQTTQAAAVVVMKNSVSAGDLQQQQQHGIILLTTRCPDEESNCNVGGSRTAWAVAPLPRFIMALVQELWVSSDVIFQGRLTWLLVLGPCVIIGDSLGVLSKATCFTLSGIALIPCAERYVARRGVAIIFLVGLCSLIYDLLGADYRT